MTLLDILKQYRVSSQYGWRTHPVTGKKNTFHQGIDLVGKAVDDAIENFVEGTVVYSGDTYPGTGLGNYGWVVMVNDRNGYSHLYAHLKKGSLKVKVGDHVVQGTILGYMGSTGMSTGKHLHYEIRRSAAKANKWGHGTHVDPFDHLIDHCKDAWVYYDKQGRKDKCDEMHETANLLRRMIGLKEE